MDTEMETESCAQYIRDVVEMKIDDQGTEQDESNDDNVDADGAAITSTVKRPRHTSSDCESASSSASSSSGEAPPKKTVEPFTVKIEDKEGIVLASVLTTHQHIQQQIPPPLTKPLDSGHKVAENEGYEQSVQQSPMIFKKEIHNFPDEEVKAAYSVSVSPSPSVSTCSLHNPISTTTNHDGSSTDQEVTPGVVGHDGQAILQHFITEHGRANAKELAKMTFSVLRDVYDHNAFRSFYQAWHVSNIPLSCYYTILVFCQRLTRRYSPQITGH